MRDGLNWTDLSEGKTLYHTFFFFFSFFAFFDLLVQILNRKARLF